MKVSLPELKLQARVSLCSVAERMGLLVSDSMERSVLSEGAAGSERLEVPETTMVLEVLTRSVRSMSETVRVPEVERPALVSEREAVCELPEPTVMAGASLEPMTVIVTVSSALTPALSVTRTP